MLPWLLDWFGGPVGILSMSGIVCEPRFNVLVDALLEGCCVCAGFVTVCCCGCCCCCCWGGLLETKFLNPLTNPLTIPNASDSAYQKASSTRYWLDTHRLPVSAQVDCPPAQSAGSVAGRLPASADSALGHLSSGSVVDYPSLSSAGWDPGTEVEPGIQ